MSVLSADECSGWPGPHQPLFAAVNHGRHTPMRAGSCIRGFAGICRDAMALLARYFATKRRLCYAAQDFGAYREGVVMKIVHLCFAFFAGVVSAPVAFCATISLDPKAGFLRIENDTGAVAAPAIDLLALGLGSGDRIRLDGRGAYDRGGGFGAFFDLIGVLSASATLLPGDLLNRVPGAIDAGVDIATLPTNFGGSPTDIPEDFWISAFDGSIRGGEITIPDGARFLFVGTADTYFEDNQSLGGWALDITKVAAVSVPPALPSLAFGLAAMAVFRRRGRAPR